MNLLTKQLAKQKELIEPTKSDKKQNNAEITRSQAKRELESQEEKISDNTAMISTDNADIDIVDNSNVVTKNVVTDLSHDMIDFLNNVQGKSVDFSFFKMELELGKEKDWAWPLYIEAFNKGYLQAAGYKWYLNHDNLP